MVLSTAPPVDATPPAVTAFSPASGSLNVAINSIASITFSETLNPATINSNTVFLRGASNTVVPATVTYNSPTNSVTLTTINPLSNSTTYTVVVKGGSSGVTDLSGNALVADATSSFTTIATPVVRGFRIAVIQQPLERVSESDHWR